VGLQLHSTWHFNYFVGGFKRPNAGGKKQRHINFLQPDANSTIFGCNAVKFYLDCNGTLAKGTESRHDTIRKTITVRKTSCACNKNVKKANGHFGNNRLKKSQNAPQLAGFLLLLYGEIPYETKKKGCGKEYCNEHANFNNCGNYLCRESLPC